MNSRASVPSKEWLGFAIGLIVGCTEITKIDRTNTPEDKASGGASVGIYREPGAVSRGATSSTSTASAVSRGATTSTSTAGAGQDSTSAAIGGAASASSGARTAPADATDVVVAGEYPVPRANGRAPTPPMGWSSWNAFACDIRATDVQRIADAMVSNGMKDAGYEYVNIDDCWQDVARSADGTVQVSPKFLDGFLDPQGNPGSMSSLVDYVHSLGLKIGLYSDRGTETCGHRAGALGHERSDAEAYAAWGIDYLKYDNCAAEEATIREQYQLMRDELNRAAATNSATTQRPIVYSLCAWNFYQWGPETGQLWRTTTDITPVWFTRENKGSVVACAARNTQFAAYSGPNGWNDPDMLEIGVGSLANSVDEQRSHFNLWAMMAAPLIAGNDVTRMNESVRAILTNRAVIEVDQDPFGLQGFPVRSIADSTGQPVQEIWLKPLSERGQRAVLLLNKGDVAVDIALTLADLNLAPGPLIITDLWSTAVWTNERTPFVAKSVPVHGSVMLKVEGIEPAPPRGVTYVSDLPWIYAANGSGPVERDMTVGKSVAQDGDPITLDQIRYAKGLGVAAGSKIIYRLGGACRRFSARVNLDDALTLSGSVAFKIYGDEELLFDGPVMKPDSKTLAVDVSVVDKYRLTLKVISGTDTPNSADRGVWADATLTCD